MKYHMIIKPQAELDILETAKWYEKQRQELGLRFLEAVDEKITIIEKNPLQYQKRHKDTRFALLKRFPYAIHFIVAEDKIYVLAVLSTSINPQIWKS